MKGHQTILGISPGTRVTGIAIFYDTELIEWKVKTLRGRWNSEKLKRLILFMRKTIDRYAARSMVVKILQESKSSAGLKTLIASLRDLAQEKHCSYYTCTLKDLKTLYKGFEVNNKRELVEAVVGKHPELGLIRDKENRSKYRYYTKMFEAIACAHTCLRKQP